MRETQWIISFSSTIASNLLLSSTTNAHDEYLYNEVWMVRWRGKLIEIKFKNMEYRVSWTFPWITSSDSNLEPRRFIFLYHLHRWYLHIDVSFDIMASIFNKLWLIWSTSCHRIESPPMDYFIWFHRDTSPFYIFILFALLIATHWYMIRQNGIDIHRVMPNRVDPL